MNERFTLESTVTEIAENDRVNKKLPIFFDLELCGQVKWPFSKMKLKNMMKMTKFPGQELVDAANFILARREAGEKITIPIWRGLPEDEAEAAENVVLIPFVSKTKDAPAVLICPEWENGRQRMMDQGVKTAEIVSELGYQAFVLNLRTGSEADDMARAVRFIRANYQKLHVIEDKIVLMVFGEMKVPARKLYFHSKRIKDVTHRYDQLKCEPEELWVMAQPDEDADKEGVYFSDENSLLTDAGRQWLEGRLKELTGEGVSRMTKDMTQGNALGLILRFALPLLVGNLLQQTYNMIDAAIVGRFLGTQALAGVGATSSVQFLVLGFCTGLCSGFGVPVARDFGANQLERMRKDIFHGAFLTIVIAAILTAGCVTLCPWILKMLSVTEDIYANAHIYILIIFFGLPFTLLYNFLSSILRAVGDSRTPFMFLAFSACLNVVLDLVCIIVFKWGCAGAAIATITAQAISGICCLIFIIKKVQVLHPKREDCRLRTAYVKEMLVMGLPMGLQFSITAIGSMVMQSANNGLGSIYVSGFTAGMRIKQFAMCPFDALANGVSVFCSQNLGAGKIERIRKGLWQGVAVGFTYGLLIGLVLIFAGRPLSLLFISADQTAVLDASAKYLRCLGFFYWSLGPLSVFRMSAQGMGFSGRAIFSGVTEMIARTFVSFAFVGTYGFTAICFADQTAWVSATLYITPVCLMCLRQVTREHEKQQAQIAG